MLGPGKMSLLFPKKVLRVVCFERGAARFWGLLEWLLCWGLGVLIDFMRERVLIGVSEDEFEVLSIGLF